MDNEEELETSWPLDYIQLLVIADNRHNYYEVFQNVRMDGIEVKIEQACWKELFLTTGLRSTEKNPHGISILLNGSTRRNAFPQQKEKRVIIPHLLLIRNLPRGDEDNDFRNVLFGLMFAGIPSINSLEAVYFGLERVLVFGALKKIQREYGEKFPLIHQCYHVNGPDLVFSPIQYPKVCKVSHAHAGIGKAICKDKHSLMDVRSLISLHKDYVTTEPFIEADYELRIQKIGQHYRCMKKVLCGKYWKSNTFGSSTIQDMELTPLFKFWIEATSQIFGGLDICALDVLHCEKTDSFHILEVNGTAIGLDPNHVEEDVVHERNLVVSRIRTMVCPKDEKKQEKSNGRRKIFLDDDDKDVTIMNLKNEISRMKKVLKGQKKKRFLLC